MIERDWNEISKNKESKNKKMEQLTSIDQSNQTFSFNRLQTQLSTTIKHGENEKHRIIFTVSKKIQFCGVGLQQNDVSTKIFMMLLRKGPIGPDYWNKTLASQAFGYPSGSIQFPRPVPLLPGETYLILVSFYGGQSFLSSDGLESVNAVIDAENQVLFKFETFKGGDESVERGVIRKFFFKLQIFDRSDMFDIVKNATRL